MNIEEGSLLAVERQRVILNILERDGVVRNTELKELLGVSSATVRADLRELESTGVCEMVWGGAIARNRPRIKHRPSFIEPSDLNAEAKRQIGTHAARLLETGQTIIVDAGSTTLELIHHIAADIEYLRVITPALNIATAVAQLPHIELVLTGGILRHLTRSLVGLQVQAALQMVNADWTFLATGGFSIEHGITTSNTLEAEVKKMMAERAAKLVLLADSSKYGKVLSLNVAPITEVDIIITDSCLSDEAAEALQSLNIEVIRA